MTDSAFEVSGEFPSEIYDYFHDSQFNSASILLTPGVTDQLKHDQAIKTAQEDLNRIDEQPKYSELKFENASEEIPQARKIYH